LARLVGLSETVFRRRGFFTAAKCRMRTPRFTVQLGRRVVPSFPDTLLVPLVVPPFHDHKAAPLSASLPETELCYQPLWRGAVLFKKQWLFLLAIC
jgi:hypothetical protein